MPQIPSNIVIDETDASLSGPLRMWISDGADSIPVGIVETSLTSDTAGDYLRDIPTAQSLSSHQVRCVGQQPSTLYPFNVASSAANPTSGVFLLEGRAPSRNSNLRVELLLGDKTVLTMELPVQISTVENFYRWYNLRIHGGKAAGRPTDVEEPTAFPDNASDGTSVVFIHGFRVTAEGARAWNAEMFKRLWQSGCNAKFHAFTWRGNDGAVSEGGLNYHGNVVHAFETAAAFAATNAQSVSGSTTVLAHSLGNMVVSSAIQDHGFRPARYFMLNAAVPAEAFDSTQWNTDETNNPFEFEDWVGFPSNSWASCWHSLFPTNDIRSRLTWKGRFADVPQLTTLYNYYSTGDEVLSIFDTPDADGSGKITVHPFGVGGKRYHAWQKQERFKGRWGQSALGGWGGTSEMGWGFETFGHWTNGMPPMYELGDPALPYVTPVRMHAYTIQQALAATDDQLRADPVFNHEPPEILSGNLQSGNIDILLARGVPALSGPAGSVPMDSDFDMSQLNMNTLIDSTIVPMWPHRYELKWNGWLHNDVKDVAYPLVHQVFVNISIGGSQ